MNNFKFNNPWLLFLIIPLIALIVVGFFLMKKEKRYTKKNLISFSLHIVIAVLVSIAFADPMYLSIDKTTEVYILADASASEKPSVERIDEAIKNVTSEALKTPNTKVGVIPFAKEAKTLTELGGTFNSINDVYNDASFDYTATNLENALLYTSEKFSKDSYKRIVLISDGNETDGQAINTIETLMEQGVTVDVINLKADFPLEISLTSLLYTDNTYLNREEEAKAFINASTPSNVTVELYRNDQLEESKNTYLSSGLNEVSFTLDTSVAGEYEYRVEVKKQEGEDKFNDTFEENNVRSFIQTVSADFKILFIGEAQSQLNKFEEMADLSEETTIDSYIGKKDVPYLLEDLIDYDEIVFSDLDLTSLNHYEELVTNLSTAISVYGKSLFTFDATYVGNTNDPALVSYNDLLPVQYQPDDSRALVLVIDTSGSMGGNDLDMARSSAKAVVDKLDVNDSIAVVTFESGTTVPVTMTTIRNEENRQDIKDKIDRLQDNGGTEMLPGLQEAYKQIQGVTAEYKDIFVMSDGEVSSPDDVKKYVTELGFSNISCSFINVGGEDSEGEELMKTLAKLGNGQYRYVDSATGVKDIIIDAIEEEIIDTVIEKDSPVIYMLKDDPSLQGGVYNNLENVMGVNYCRMKSGASTVVSVQYIHTNSENELSVIAIPLYAYWDFGNGKVSSFTSSLDTGWTTKFWNAAAGKTFFKNMVNQSFPDRFNKSLLNIEFDSNGSTSDVKVTTNADTKNAKASIEIKDLATSESSSYELTYDGSRFSYKVPTPNVGFYEATVKFSKLNSATNEYELVEETKTIFSFDYSSEFNFFDDSKNTLLNQLASQCGGSILAENNIHFDIDSNQLTEASYISLMVWILLAAVIVYLADITVRKSIFRKKEKKEVSQPADNYF